MSFKKKNNFKEVIVKPELGAFKTGFKIIKNVNEKKIKDYLERLKKNDYRRILIQEFIPEFNKFKDPLKVSLIKILLLEYIISFQKLWQHSSRSTPTQTRDLEIYPAPFRPLEGIP